jgi:hypothetical protein
MLAEKFFLVLETLRSHARDDWPEIVTSSARPAEVPPVESGSRRKKQAADERD